MKNRTILRITHRLTTLVVSVCCVFSVAAQQFIPQRIRHIIESKNYKEAEIFMQQIQEVDIVNLPDSSLLDFYYMAGWNSSENKDYEKQIEYLVKAKELCETKLGIYNYVEVYFEIIKALGEACEDLDRDDDALLWYEEGVIKGLAFMNSRNATFQTYFKDIRENAADIYKRRGNLDIATYLRSNSGVDSFHYASDLVDKAVLMYHKKEYCETMKLLDEAEQIFKNYGVDGVDMLQAVYFVYMLCYAQQGDKKHINTLISSKGDAMFYNDKESSLVSYMDEVIAIFTNVHHNIKTADYYYRKLQQMADVHNPDEMKEVEKIGSRLKIFKNIYAQIDSLENERTPLPMYSYEWGLTSLRKANLLIRIQRIDEGIKIYEQIYDMSANLKDDPQKLHWFVLMNLSDYYNVKQNYDCARKYLNEQLSWLDSQAVPFEHEERGWVYNKLGLVSLKENRFIDAKEMFAKAEKIMLPIFGPKSDEYATLLHNRGRAAQLEGQLDEALQLFEEAAKIQTELNGKVMDRTAQYIEEVKHAIEVRL